MALLSTLALLGWRSLFSNFLPYDDEGYVMISVAGVVRGHALYSEVFSHYGPAFFLWRRALHGPLGLPLTHEATRWLALAEWAVAALLSGVLVRRLTGRTGAALAAAGLAFLYLEVMVKEPGHPQGLCQILLLLALVLTCPRRPEGALGGASAAAIAPVATVAPMVAAGAACAALLLIKVNIGGLLVLAFLLTLALAAPPSRWRRLALVALTTTALAAPFVLLWAGLGYPGQRGLTAAISLAIAAALVTAVSRARSRGVGAATVMAYLGGLAAGVTAIVGLTLVAGTPWRDLLEGALLAPARFARSLGQTNLRLPVGAAPLAAVALLTALAMMVACRRSLQVRTALPVSSRLGFLSRLAQLDALGSPARLQVVPALVILVPVVWSFLRDSDTVFVAGNVTRGNSPLLLAYGGAALWLLLVPMVGAPASPASQENTAVGRTLLVLTALLQLPVAYPVFGSQLAFATVLLPLCGVVALAEALPAGRAGASSSAGTGGTGASVASAANATSGDSGWSQWPWKELGSAALVVLVLVAALLRADAVSERWRAQTPLALPGAEQLRLSATEVEEFHCLVDGLALHADTFYTVYGLNSLYFWTGLEPPAYFNATMWPWMLSPEQEQATIAALGSFQRAAVVSNRLQGYLRRHRRAGDLSLLGRYLDENFTPALRCGRFDLLLRNDQLPVEATP